MAYDEQKKEGKDKDQEEETLKTMICKMIPKYKIISKKEFDSLLILKVITPLKGKHLHFQQFTQIDRGRLQSALIRSVNNVSTLRSNFKTPLKLPTFCGIDESQKGEVTYEDWSFKVRCLINSQALPDAVLLKGIASSLLLSLG